MKFLKGCKIHYGWFILIMCCMMFGSCMGIYANCAGLYTAPMLSEFGWSYTKITLIGITQTVARIYGSGIADRIFRKYPLRLVLSLAVVIMMGAAWFTSMMHDAFAYTVINILVGFAGAFVLYIPVPMLINNWFTEKKDTALGVAMLCSGLMAAVFSPIFNSLIENYGWRQANAVNAVIGLLVALPPVLLFAVKTPEEMGLKPYGWKDPEPMKVVTSPSDYFEGGEHPDFDTRYSVKEKKEKYRLSLVLAMFIMAISVVPSRLAHFGATSYVGAATGALMFSVSQFGNMASKLVMGPLCDKYGPKKTYVTSVSLVFLSLLLLCFMPHGTVLLLVLAFLTGLSAGNNMMIYPAAARTYSKGEEYSGYIAKISMGMNIFWTPFSLVMSALYDITGTYTLTFVLMAALDFVCIFLTLKMFPKKVSS
ncbi:MAG: MFS transporter [Lachnospiraceae bacterium]|nr:MFS transporter [Lachnospiraceae bacterium]